MKDITPTKIIGFVAFVAAVAFLVKARLDLDHSAEVTWYRAKSYSVAANPRHRIPDGAYIKFTNTNVAPEAVVVVEKRGHMAPGAKADFDLCPEAFAKLTPLTDGRLKGIRWEVIYP